MIRKRQAHWSFAAPQSSINPTLIGKALKHAPLGSAERHAQENHVKPLPHSQLGLRRKRRCQLADDALAFARWQHPDGGNERVAVQLADGTDSTIDGEELLKGPEKGEGGGKGVE